VAEMFGTPASVRQQNRVVTLSSSTIPPTELALATASAPSSSTETVTPAAPVTTTTANLVLGSEATGLVAPTGPTAAWWQHLITAPKTALQYAYYVLSIIIVLILVYVTELEFHRRHLRHVAAALALLLLMVALLVFANSVLFAQPIIAAV